MDRGVGRMIELFGQLEAQSYLTSGTRGAFLRSVQASSAPPGPAKD
jgi:hypothetical protein